MRAGIGYDIHRLVDKRKLYLGGIHIPYNKGLFGHSDGDVLIHAIIDAIFGSIADGDIGMHFPNTDPAYKDISSVKLLKKTNDYIARKGYTVCNIDSTIIAEKPKLSPFKTMMADKIADTLGIPVSNINIKAGTNEGLGSIGKGRAIAAYAVVLIRKKAKNRIRITRI